MDEYKKKTNTGDNVFIRIHPQTTAEASTNPTPTVVLMGWLSSKPKHVAKYAAIWEAMGYNTVQSIAPISVVFPLTQRTTAIYLLSILRILHRDDRLMNGGLVFQLFSNGGAVIAPHLSTMLNAFFTDDEADATTALTSNKDMRVTLKRHANYLDFIKADDRVVVTKKMVICDLPREFWEDVTNAKYRCPELYIYSRVDHLILIPKLESMIEHRKQIGRQVRVFCVDDAPHVAIFRKHPDAYCRTLGDSNEWGINAWRKRNSLNPWRLDDNNTPTDQS